MYNTQCNDCNSPYEEQTDKRLKEIFLVQITEKFNLHKFYYELPDPQFPNG